MSCAVLDGIACAGQIAGAIKNGIRLTLDSVGLGLITLFVLFLVFVILIRSLCDVLVAVVIVIDILLIASGDVSREIKLVHGLWMKVIAFSTSKQMRQAEFSKLHAATGSW